MLVSFIVTFVSFEISDLYFFFFYPFAARVFTYFFRFAPLSPALFLFLLIFVESVDIEFLIALLSVVNFNMHRFILIVLNLLIFCFVKPSSQDESQ